MHVTKFVMSSHQADKNVEDEKDFAERRVWVDVAKADGCEHDEHKVEILPEISHRVGVHVRVVFPRISVTLQLMYAHKTTS